MSDCQITEAGGLDLTSSGAVERWIVFIETSTAVLPWSIGEWDILRYLRSLNRCSFKQTKDPTAI